jgi:rod shape-determining protein MreB and related proteins
MGCRWRAPSRAQECARAWYALTVLTRYRDQQLMRFLPFSTGLSSRDIDIAVDLGTVNTVVCAQGGELVLVEPSIVAVDARSGAALAAGSEALPLLGGDGIAAIRPLRGGVIVDLHGAAEMLRCLIGNVQPHGRRQSPVIASMSGAVGAVQRRAVVEACRVAGLREGRLIATPIAAALGSGLPVGEPIGSMVLDLGGGRCEVAVISMGAVVASRSIPVGGCDFDQRIVAHLKRRHSVLIGEQTAEQIKVQIGSASIHAQDAQIEILARDMASETLKRVWITGQEIRGTLESQIKRVIQATKETLACTPPQLASDVMDLGITLTGGGSLLHGLAERLSRETGTPARVADGPFTCTAIGAARALDKQPLVLDRPRTANVAVTTAAVSN